jgi:redox-sensitive bicupin YhaK (pirin superfamily)
MIQVRRSEERGHANRGWLESYHTFSFADYYDPRWMGFRSLRVINEDWIEPGRGFGTHPHQDMEIITYVVEGGLAHRDSTGTAEVIRPGEVQRMSAGTGIAHSEFNHSQQEPVHLLQIWLLPERTGLEPGYEQRAFPESERRGTLRLVAAPDGSDGAVTVRQDVSLFAGLLEPGQSVEHRLRPDRYAWMQLIRGAVTLNGQALAAGDGAAVSEEETLRITAQEDAEFLLFDLA